MIDDDERPTVQLLSDPASRNDIVLWHVTSAARADAIEKDGLLPMSYWSSDGAIADYYVDNLKFEGEEAVMFSTTLDRLPVAFLEADRPGLQEPVTTVTGSEEEVDERYREALKESGGIEWIASLAAIGSLRCRSALPASAFERVRPADPAPGI